MKINVTFTGICAFVEHQRGATVIIPNARRIRGMTHGGAHAHVPSHIPFLEYRTDPKQEGLKQGGQVLFSYRFHRRLFEVVELATSAGGWRIYFQGTDGGKFIPRPPELHWDNVVDLDRVAAGCAIDDSLVSSFDPRSDRVAARVPIEFGTLTPRPQPDVYATFLPPAEKPYSGRFVQEVIWEVTYTADDQGVGGKKCELLAIPFGAEENSPGDRLLMFEDYGQPFEISIGNAPFEDIIRKGTGARDLIDHHFAAYYELLLTPPPVIRLPHRTSERFRRARSGGGNCPPAKIPLR